MKVAVTGSAGFIGQHVIRELATRVEPSHIACLVRSAEQRLLLEPLGVRTVIGTLQDHRALEDLCRNAEAVFHLAARVRYGVRPLQRVDFHRDNVEGTARLLECCPSSVRRFVHMSSINAVERPPGDPCRLLLTEESPCCPRTPYGRSKLQAEEIVRHKTPSRGISYLILRPPSIVYGPGCNRGSGMATFIRSVASGSWLTTLNFPGRLSILHVKDLAQATVRLGLSEVHANQTFFLAQEPPLRVLEIADRIAARIGVTRRYVCLPRTFYSMLNVVSSGMERVPFLRGAIPFQLLMLLRDQGAVSSQKARVEAGFITQVQLNDGLAETIPWVLPRLPCR